MYLHPVGYDDDLHDVYHSVKESFGPLLRASLLNEKAIAAMGPIYDVDPGAVNLAPFVRSAKESGLDPEWLEAGALAPKWILDKVLELRSVTVSNWDMDSFPEDLDDAVHWTRAGLVLEIASRRGIPLSAGLKAHVKWKMKGTVTGRFGVEPGGYNPLIIAREKTEGRGEFALWRSRVIASAPNRVVAAIDFRAMDLSSMISLVPDLPCRYEGAADLHGRTAELVGISRDEAKHELFVHAYGGYSSYSGKFERHLPELAWLRQMPHGAGACLVQSTSAKAFRAGLSRALPLLVHDDIRPMFTVHDELVLDVLSDASSSLAHVTKALEQGASERIGVPYNVGMKIGKNYAEAKAP